jgi:hypothetical protein
MIAGPITKQRIPPLRYAPVEMENNWERSASKAYGLNGLMVRAQSPGRLCPNQGRYEKIEVGWVDVAYGDDAQVWCRGGVEGEACAGAR